MESGHHSLIFRILSVIVLLSVETAMADTFLPVLDRPDVVTTRVEFDVTLMGFIPVRGQFHEVSAIRADAVPAADTAMNFSVDVDSIDTQNAGRDAFLRSSAFFDAGRFPTIRFTARQLVQRGDGNTRLLGDLTLHGTTRQIAFTLATPQTNGDENPSHGERLAAQATIRRDEFGLDALPMPVSNEVQVRVYVADPVSGFTPRRLSRAD